MKYLEVIAVSLSLLGTLMVTCKMREGFLCWAIANIYWIYDSYDKFPRVLMWVTYWVMAIYGWATWA